MHHCVDARPVAVPAAVYCSTRATLTYIRTDKRCPHASDLAAFNTPGVRTPTLLRASRSKVDLAGAKVASIHELVFRFWAASLGATARSYCSGYCVAMQMTATPTVQLPAVHPAMIDNIQASAFFVAYEVSRKVRSVNVKAGKCSAVMLP